MKLESWNLNLRETWILVKLEFNIDWWNVKLEYLELESIWINFLRRLVRNGYKRVNVPPSRRRNRSRSSRSSRSSQSETTVETGDDEDIDWRFRLTNQNIMEITKSEPISKFCLSQHLKYIAHVTRLPNSAIQKQILFQTNKKRYARNPWHKYEEITQLSKTQLQREMQNKQQFLSLLDQILDTQLAATADRGNWWWWWWCVNLNRGFSPINPLASKYVRKSIKLLN